jgi:diaminopimelate epimerase
MKINFSKYQGTGNDFILIDNRSGSFKANEKQIEVLCNRRFGIGADGLILLNQHADYDFEMVTHNSDGRQSTMCGNGGRCLVQFAHSFLAKNEKNHSFRFVADDGEHEAKIESGLIYLKMQNVLNVRKDPLGFILDTGSPHLVYSVKNVDTIDVVNEGRALRNLTQFGADGININFVQIESTQLRVRTYERGVEDETLSCGTGIIASALTTIDHALGAHEIEVQARGGLLRVRFEKEKGPSYQNIWLIGPAQKSFEGTIEI